KFKIGNVERHQFGTAKCAGKAKQENSPVANSFEVGRSLGHHRENLVSGGRCFAARGGSFRPPHCSPCGFDDLGVRWRLVAGELMSVANGGKPPADRGYFRTAGRLGRQEGCNSRRRGREIGEVLRLAPAAELSEIRFIGSPRGLRLLALA